MAGDEVVSAKAPKDQGKKSSPSLVYPQTIVTVNVSSPKGKGTFPVYKDFICYYSPFFRSAFNSQFKEGETQTMELSDTHSVVFGSFVTWLYTQDLAVYRGNPTLSPNLINLWILADHAIVPRLQNLIMRILCAHSTAWCPSRSIVITVYAKTSPESALRKFAVKTFALRTPDDQLHPMIGGLPDEIVQDIVACLKGVLNKNQKARYSILPAKEYYVGGEAELEPDD